MNRTSQNLGGTRFEKETTVRSFSSDLPAQQSQFNPLPSQQSNLQFQQFPQQQSQMQQPMTQQPLLGERQFQGSTQLQQLVEPAIIQEKPAVIHERIRKEEVEEIQPVIHREHERLEVHQITKPMVEQIVQPTVIQERVLQAETRAPIQRGVYIGGPVPAGTSDVQSFHKVVEKSPIIYEIERKKILEEIQPVLYKEILQPTIIRQTKDIYEKVIDAPVILTSTLPSQFIGKNAMQGAPLMASTTRAFNPDQNLQSSSLQSSNLQSQNLQQPSQFIQRETVDRWVSPAPATSTRV